MATKSKTPVQPTQDRLIYAGPNIFKLGLSTGTVYVGGIPKQVPDELSFAFVELGEYQTKTSDAAFQRKCADVTARIMRGAK